MTWSLAPTPATIDCGSPAPNPRLRFDIAVSRSLNCALATSGTNASARAMMMLRTLMVCLLDVLRNSGLVRVILAQSMS